MQPDLNDSPLRRALQELIGQTVVLDTSGEIVYLGRMVDVDDTGVWLEDADVHDCGEGHAGKEYYVIESAHHGVRVNRRRVFVLRSSIMSVSGMSDIVTDINEDRELLPPTG